MGKLMDAMQAAEDRKAAVFGDPDGPSIVSAEDGIQERAMFYGFDLDYDELKSVVDRVTWFYGRQVYLLPVPRLIVSAWVDGLLAGLFTAVLSSPHKPAGDDTPAGGGE